MKTHFNCCWVGALLLLLFNTIAAAEELRSVPVQDIELTIPTSWQTVPLKSKFRLAQFDIPGATPGHEKAELAIFHFGGPTGGIQANLNRWIDQFQPKDRQVELFEGQSREGQYLLADISGTWQKPVGPPINRQTVDRPDSRVLAVILLVDKHGMKDYYFLKLAGPDTLVQSQADTLRQAIGADQESEKRFPTGGVQP